MRTFDFRSPPPDASVEELAACIRSMPWDVAVEVLPVAVADLVLAEAALDDLRRGYVLGDVDAVARAKTRRDGLLAIVRAVRARLA